ncbi:biotin--acetyl-CoA-carboxylase, putative [Plasmodium malariae]|uniref:Biotin--acetyl-CoA-carboxylase, putative n=1 Tax=Plasmodium malariae TaxID=5858 RepID=A0A1C3KDY7_PLAMA|nr:biotin--acetyl-CoA-carboxylase, putative [Plasmodium malariae]
MEKVIFEKFCAEFNALHIHLDVIDSTQLYSRRNLKEFIDDAKLKDNKNMIIVSCNSQTNGIGTRDTKKNVDRKWLSEEGNVFVTFTFLWNKEDIQKVSCLAQTSTVAISKTLECFHLVPRIKWINDVLVNDKKIAGCLVNLYFLDDISLSLSKDYVCVMVGIGINVHLTDDKNILHNKYTSIKKELLIDFNIMSLIPSVEEVTKKLIENLYSCIHKLHDDGFSHFLDYITDRLLYKGRKVIIDQDNTEVVGYVRGILHDGSLILLDEKNDTVHVNTGHLHLYNKC